MVCRTRVLLGSVLVAVVACEPGPPDTPEAREAVAVCEAQAPAEALVHRVPDRKWEGTLAAAAKKASSLDMSAATAHYRRSDLGERATAIRKAAEKAGVKACKLADELAAQATLTPGADDLSGVVKVLEATATVSPEYLVPILAAGCAELPACARECVPGLAGVGEAPPDQRAIALANGCAAFRSQVTNGAPAVEAFVRARMSAFIDVCAPQLSGSSADAVARARASIGL